MKRLRLAAAFAVLAAVSSPRFAQAAPDACPRAFWSSSTGTCGATGHVSAIKPCICEYDCEFNSGYYDFC